MMTGQFCQEDKLALCSFSGQMADFLAFGKLLVNAEESSATIHNSQVIETAKMPQH
jgi:hypothetical protein